MRSIAWRFLEDAGVGVAAFNTPKNLHCLLPNLLMEIFLVLEHARRHPGLRALVWTATGTKAFSAGGATKGDMQIHASKALVRAYQARGMGPVRGDLVMAPHTRAFWDFPKPVVMAVNGLAVGGGANFALANFGDVVLASKQAKFRWPFAQVGASPELGSSLVLPQLLGLTEAKRLLLTGAWLDASEARRLNLVSELCEPEHLLPRALEVAAALGRADTAPLIKELLNAPLRAQLDETLLREQETLERALSMRKNGSQLLILQNHKSKL